MTVALIAIFLVVIVVSLLISAGLLWAGAKISRIPNVRYRRCIVTVLVITVINLAISVCFRLVPGMAPSLVTALVELGVQLFVTLLVIKVMLHATLLQSLLTWVFQITTGAVYAFAVVFILLLCVEAFVIPTGSMAETMLGYHKTVICPQCGHVFAVNASIEAETPPGLLPQSVSGCTCPNCREQITLPTPGSAAGNPALEGGDRFLVLKVGYGTLDRFQVVPFNYPQEQEDRQSGMIAAGHEPIRYVQRLVGLPGETIAIHGGKLYVAEGLAYDGRPRPEKAQDAWKSEFTYPGDNEALEWFKQGKFQILRKPPELVLTMRRLVYDNDHQALDLIGKQPPRWDSDPTWKPDNVQQPRSFTFPSGGQESIAWLRYRHLLRGEEKPSLITDFSGYNTWNSFAGLPGNWAGDLMLECTIRADKAAGELRLELARGPDRFQLRFDLTSGDCAAVRLSADGEKELAKSPTDLKKAGDYVLRFANVDQRLLLWINDVLQFGDGVTYDAPASAGPVPANDLQPAAIGCRQAGLSVAHIKLWRDTYYTNLQLQEGSPPHTMYVQPGNYLMLGDNSPQSRDSRDWGLVPERLILGPAVLTYWPPARFGRIR
jgi:signal peptidase I